MFLLVVNYQNELNQNIFSSREKFDIKILNESKGYLFGLKLLKILLENKGKYDFVLHFGLCGAKDSSNIGKIYKIDRSFLFDKNIIENQRFRHGSFKFETIENSNIVTKFSLGKNPSQIYDFAEIFDLETFWVANVSNQIGIPVFSIKGVSDANDCIFEDSVDEVQFLLNPEDKRKKKDFYIENLKENINIANTNLNIFFEKEFMDFYNRFQKDKDFKKTFYI